MKNNNYFVSQLFSDTESLNLQTLEEIRQEQFKYFLLIINHVRIYNIITCTLSLVLIIYYNDLISITNILLFMFTKYRNLSSLYFSMIFTIISWKNNNFFIKKYYILHPLLLNPYKIRHIISVMSSKTKKNQVYMAYYISSHNQCNKCFFWFNSLFLSALLSVF